MNNNTLNNTMNGRDTGELNCVWQYKVVLIRDRLSLRLCFLFCFKKCLGSFFSLSLRHNQHDWSVGPFFRACLTPRNFCQNWLLVETGDFLTAIIHTMYFPPPPPPSLVRCPSIRPPARPQSRAFLKKCRAANRAPRQTAAVYYCSWEQTASRSPVCPSRSRSCRFETGPSCHCLRVHAQKWLSSQVELKLENKSNQHIWVTSFEPLSGAYLKDASLCSLWYKEKKKG